MPLRYEDTCDACPERNQARECIGHEKYGELALLGVLHVVPRPGRLMCYGRERELAEKREPVQPRLGEGQ